MLVLQLLMYYFKGNPSITKNMPSFTCIIKREIAMFTINSSLHLLFGCCQQFYCYIFRLYIFIDNCFCF